MQNEDLAALLNAGYVCPAGAGPAWRQAMADGIDMSLLEKTLSKSPWERLVDHDEASRFASMLQRAAGSRDE